MAANGDSKTASNYQEKFYHKFGNLTISAYNPNLINFAFDVKRDRKDKNANYIGYRNGLFLNENLEDVAIWTIDKIKIRQEKLVRIAIKQYKIY